jgi:hypothetical protein
MRVGDPLQLHDYRLDAHNMANDSISSVSASPNTATNGVVSTMGIVMEFGFYTTPSLAASYRTNTLTLIIPYYPQDSRLQSSPRLGQSAQWQDYSVQTETRGFFKYADIPATSLPRTIYFRLIETRVPAPP